MVELNVLNIIEGSMDKEVALTRNKIKEAFEQGKQVILKTSKPIELSREKKIKVAGALASVIAEYERTFGYSGVTHGGGRRYCAGIVGCA